MQALRWIVASVLSFTGHSALADTRVVEQSRSGIRYEALLSGAWQEMPPQAGAQLTYGSNIGSVNVVICTFGSDEPPFLRSISKDPDWAKAFARQYTDTLKTDPQSILAALMKSRSRFSLARIPRIAPPIDAGER